MTPDYDYGAHTQILLFFCFMFMLCYCHDQKTGIAFTGIYWHAQISVPKISTSISKTACINPWYVHRRCFDVEKTALKQLCQYLL